jgi:hypothetical protein
VTFPLTGPAEIAGDVEGYWPDGWAGGALEIPLIATGPVRAIELRIFVPDYACTPITLRAALGSWEAETEVGTGEFSWRFAAPMPENAGAVLTILSTPTWVPLEARVSDDERQLAFVLKAIIVS